MHPIFVPFCFFFWYVFCNFEAFSISKIKKNSSHAPVGKNMKLRNKIHKIKKFCHVLPRSSEPLWTFKRGPEAQPTTDLLNIAEVGCNDENDSCSGGCSALFYSVWEMTMLACAHIAVQIGRKAHSGGPRANHCFLNSAEFWCSDENETCSGGYLELIYSVWGMTMLVCLDFAIRSCAPHRDWPKAVHCSITCPPQGL